MMAGVESDVLSSAEETEVHTPSDLDIIVISSGDSETGDVEFEPLSVKPEESDGDDDWKQLAYYVPGQSDEEEGVQFEAEAGVQEEEAEVIRPEVHEAEDSGASAPSQLHLFEHSYAESSSSLPHSEDVESGSRTPFSEQQDEEEVAGEEMEVASPPSRRRRGRPAGIGLSVAVDVNWQMAPNPPAKKRKTSLKESLAWTHFLVPVGTNKASAYIVKCCKCDQVLSRGRISRLNQSRGTSNMSRHLMLHHESQMSEEFCQQFRHLAAALHPDSEAAGPSCSGGSGGSPVVTAPSSSVCPTLTGAEASISSGLVCAPSTLTGPPSSEEDVSDLILLCAKCRTTIIGGNIPWEQWLDVIRAHKRGCVPK